MAILIIIIKLSYSQKIKSSYAQPLSCPFTKLELKKWTKDQPGPTEIGTTIQAWPRWSKCLMGLQVYILRRSVKQHHFLAELS